MNLMLNNYCNLKCSYCFAQETMHSINAKNISMENFIKYLDWLKKQEDLSLSRRVRLIGGEPTLHPLIFDFIDKVIEYDCFDNILIFTNLTFNHDFAVKLVEKSEKISIHLLPNINNLNLLIPSHKENIINNLNYLSLHLPEFDRISINLYSPDQDLSLWEKICSQYSINSIRFSITIPNKALSKDFNVVEYFHSYQPVLETLLNFSKKYGIRVENDCNTLPLCAFDPKFIQEALKIDPGFFAQGGCHSDEAVMDITPDLEVVGCFGLSSKKKYKLEDYNTYQELSEVFKEDRKNIYENFVTRQECLTCNHYKTFGEACTCLVYRKTEVKDYAYKATWRSY